MTVPGLAGFDLTGKVALVTGASTGIGASVAKLLAARGAAVAVNYLSSRGEAEQVVEEIAAAGGWAIAKHADVTREEEVSRLVTAVKSQLGPIDILINNAGRNIGRGRFEELGIETWDEGYRINLRSTVLVCQAVLPGMVKRGWGRVVNVTSVAARLGGANNAIYYAAAKAGMNALTVGLGHEYAKTGVLINGVAPGLIDTPFHRMGRERLERLAPTVPIGRSGAPEEVAEVIAFLASPANSYMLGEVVTVSAGR